MATRSFIGYYEDNKIVGVYCHYDGSISHNGKILCQYYNNINKIKELVELGSLSCLEKNIYPTKEHSFDKPQDNVTIAYHRDRGDDDITIHNFSSLEQLKNYIDSSYLDNVYIFYLKEWYYIQNINKNNITFMKVKDMICCQNNNNKEQINVITVYNLLIGDNK